MFKCNAQVLHPSLAKVKCKLHGVSNVFFFKACTMARISMFLPVFKNSILKKKKRFFLVVVQAFEIKRVKS